MARRDAVDALFHLGDYEGPESLAELCFKLISENLNIVSEKGPLGHRKLLKGLTFPSEIADKLIEHVLPNLTEDHDCFFTIFEDLTATKLKHVKIARSNLTDDSIAIIAKHKPVDLELVDCLNLTNRTIELINQNSENLRSFTCHNAIPGIKIDQECIQRGYLFDAPKLRRLVLRRLVIPASAFKVILAGLTKLSHLDLLKYRNVDFQILPDLVPNLVSLTLYNVKLNASPHFVHSIRKLKALRHLDISQFSYENGTFLTPNKILSEIVNGLPLLVSLDISGTNLGGVGPVNHVFEGEEGPAISCGIPGLVHRFHKPLEFLGLYGTAHGACRRQNIPAKVIAGDANENQILVAARVCMDSKEELLQNVLSDLYNVSRFENCQRTDQALCTILEVMEKYPLWINIQTSGTATLHCIMTLKEMEKLEVRMKRRIINALLAVMTAHKNEEAIMHYGCQTLYRFRIPQDIATSNYETLVKVLLYSTRHTVPESVQRIGISILNSVASQVEGREKRLLGKLGCVKTMLELVKHRVEADLFDEVLENAWSTMWNMTDETPVNCARFFEENGMDLFLKCVNQFPQKEELLKNMMGLLGNVAEVNYLRRHFMQERYVTVFADLVRTTSNGMEVSYNAAGILAHMASDGPEAWIIEKPRREEVLEYMLEAIERWDIWAQRNINYRSFLPLLRLLDAYHTPECQHWAVWALANFTSVYPDKYCGLVIEEGGIEKLNALLLDPRPYERIKELVRRVCRNCFRYRLRIQ